MVNITRELEKYDEIIYENLHKINDIYHTMTRYVAVNGKKFLNKKLLKIEKILNSK